MNKKKLEEQAEKLQKELDNLKLEIKKCDEIDIFSITTYKEVCKALNEPEIHENQFSFFQDAKKLTAFARVKQLEKLYNKDWKRDWKNNTEQRWFPYFIQKNDTWVLFYSCCIYSVSSSWVGLFKNQKISDYVGNTFLREIYIDLL